MIRIILLGRTGNNLFQYALGRVLAKRHGVSLVLDGSWFNSSGWTEVSHFLSLPIQAHVVRRWSIAARGLLKLTGRHYWEFGGMPVLRESSDDQTFDQRFLDAPPDCLLFGYFQSPLYFMEIAEELRSELNTLITASLKIPPELASALPDPRSVAVHVRRQDYLQQSIFDVCTTSYYEESIQSMRERIPGARFFIFSDDPVWCRGRFRDEDHQVVDSGDAARNPLNDMHLMSLASHHIIANSSYSWWASWLGDKPGQQVIMPTQWYAHSIKAPLEEKRWK
jgi:hypothetical protein